MVFHIVPLSLSYHIFLTDGKERKLIILTAHGWKFC